MRDRSRHEREEDYRLPVLFLLGLFICVLHLTSPKQALLSKLQESTHPADAAYIWLAGQNMRQGLYRLPRQASVSQLYSLAGVSLTKEPQASTLLIEPFSTIQLEMEGRFSIAGRHPRLAPFFFQPIPINEADAKTLTTIPGIGPALAERIVAFRDQRGGIHRPQELLAVKGIGKKKLARIRKEVRFN